MPRDESGSSLFGAVRTNPQLLNRVMDYLQRQYKFSPQFLIPGQQTLVAESSAETTAEATRRLLTDKSLSDLCILERLHALYPRRGPSRASGISPREDTRMGAPRERSVDIARFRQRFAENQELCYLDVGCCEARNTATFAAGLALPQNRAYACDVATHPESKWFVFKRSPPDTLPFEDNKMGLVTMYMSAHHFANARAAFAEARRVMAPGAWLLIREHDSAGDASRAFYDIVDALTECVLGDERTPRDFIRDYAPGKHATYRSREEWISLLDECGFDLSEKDDSSPNQLDAFYALFVRR